MTGRRFLLLQAREPGDAAAQHEQECFAGALGVPTSDVRTWDLLQGAPDAPALDAADMLLVGGSGAFSVLDTHLAWLREFMDFLEEVVVGQRFPTFASCFGFQALVTAGGGVVIRDTDNAELGTYDIHLTAAGAADPLVGVHRSGFKAQLGHKDRADRLPAGCVHLAFSDQAPYQAFRIEGAPVFATQFHPELDREGNAFRCRAYASIYAKSGVAEEMLQVIAGLEDSPEASALMPPWLEQILGGEAG